MQHRRQQILLVGRLFLSSLLLVILRGDACPIPAAFRPGLLGDTYLPTLVNQPSFGDCDVRRYGAVGDGRADDTLALQTALDAQPIVCIGPGIYLTGRLLIPSNRRLVGVGRASVLQLRDGTDHNLLQNADPTRGNTNISILDLRLEGNKTANQPSADNLAHGIALLNVKHAEIAGVVVSDFALDGIYLGRSGTVDGQTVNGGCEHVLIQANQLLANQRNGITVVRGHNIMIVNNRVRGNNTGAVADPDNFGAGAIDLEPNAADDELEAVLVQGNIVSDNAYNGIQVSRPDVPVFRDIQISGNSVTGSGRHGIMVASNTLRFITISANLVTGSQQAALVVGGGAGDAVVSANVLHSNDGGLLISNGARRVTVSANVISDIRQGAAISVDDVADIALAGNIVRDNAEAIKLRRASNVSLVGNINGDQQRAPINLDLTMEDAVLNRLVLGEGATLTGQLSAERDWNPPPLAPGAAISVTVPLTGVVAGEPVASGFAQPLPPTSLLSAAVNSDGVVVVTLLNLGESGLDSPTGRLRVDVWKH